MQQLQIPEALKTYIEVEDCSDFNLNRYYLTEDLKQLKEDIICLQERTEALRELKINYLNTTLMYGLPGTGKTMFAKYLSHTLDLPFAYINFAGIVGGYGEANSKIQAVFRFMANTKCVFMMDEIDCVTTKRSKDGGDVSRSLSSITITVMQELDYYKKEKVNSIVLAATNRMDCLDEALLSRCAIKHKMMPLTNLEKEKYIMNYLTDVGVEFSEREIQLYCSQNSRLEQRNIESDMIQGIVKWLESGKTEYHISHIS